MKGSERILITAVGGDIGQSVLQCLLETEYAGRLIGCDMDWYSAGRAMLDNFYIAPPVSNENGYFKFMKKSICDNNLKYIMPLSEAEIMYFNRNIKQYALLGVNILILSDTNLAIFSDKYKTVEFLNKLGVDTPGTILAKEYKGGLSFPFIMKPRRSSGGKGMRIINDEDDLKSCLSFSDEAIFQEAVGDIDNEITVGAFSDGEKVYSIAFQRYLGEGGMSKFVRLIKDDALNNIVEKIARASFLKGPMNIQLRRAHDKYYIFEINPRLSSTVYFRHRFGFNDAKWWLDINEGKSVSYRPLFKDGVAVRTYGGVFFDMVDCQV